MSQENNGEGNKGRKDYELTPVEPEVFIENTPHISQPSHPETVDDYDIEPLSTEEQNGWAEAIGKLGRSLDLYPEREELRSQNVALVSLVGSLYKKPRPRVDRLAAEDELEDICAEIAGIIQEILTKEYTCRVSDDEFIHYAAELIHDNAIDRVTRLNRELGDEIDRHFKYPKPKKITLWVSAEVENADDATALAANLVEIYGNFLSNDMSRVKILLKDAYRQHDNEKMGENIDRIVRLLQKIEYNTDPDNREY